MGRFQTITILSARRQLLRAKPTFDKHFRRPKSDGQLLRMKPSVKRLENEGLTGRERPKADVSDPGNIPVTVLVGDTAQTDPSSHGQHHSSVG